MILEDSVFTWLESIERIRHNKSSEADITESADVAQDQPYLGITLFDMSLISPAVSPLSLDSLSCDFEEQMHPESEHSSEVQQITESLEMDVMENLELLAASEEYLQSHHNDQMNVASSVWNIQSEENRSHFQGSLTFLNTSPEGYVIDNPTEADCAGGVIPKGLEPEPLIDTEYDLISYSACSLAPCEYAAREKEQTKDCYLSQLDISTSLNEQNDTWGASKTALKGFEQRDFTNHTLDSQALQKPAHASSNQTSSIHRNQQHPTHKDHTQIITTDPYYDLSGAEKNRSIETGPSLNPNSVYTSPPNPLSSSTSHCYSFEDQRQDNSTYRGDFCSYSVDESDVSIPSFEGVAQSFPAPVNKPHPYSISTPLLNDDWLFSNIVAEQDFNSMVRSQGCAHC
ncbi:uncharacterized protein LOC111193325 [Astyanax mexicanus]|uniref:uncharacterized protein LOC111193325 n=1 Tax=Astyanax mexicanus TaxID=7994 RepID=UPI0020CAAE41|nr:uncharacterized protein LOC111193325 [Astyanax mexicanus]